MWLPPRPNNNLITQTMLKCAFILLKDAAANLWSMNAFGTILWTENNHFSYIFFSWTLEAMHHLAMSHLASFNALISTRTLISGSYSYKNLWGPHYPHLINFVITLFCLLTYSHLTYNIYFEARQALFHCIVTNSHFLTVTNPLFKD